MSEVDLGENITFSESELKAFDALLDEHRIGSSYLVIAFRMGIRCGIERERKRIQEAQYPHLIAP